jgi:hypothetical protein
MTPGRIAASRENAQHSTGPRTPEGKAAAAQNARTHGLLSRVALLPGEDGDALRALREALVLELAPVGELGVLLADRVIACAWRLRRAQGVEVGVFEHREPSKADQMLARLARGREEDATPSSRLGQAFVEDGQSGDTFSKLARYETTLERSLFRALHELQRLQAARAGIAVPPPVAVDVTVTEAEAAV